MPLFLCDREFVSDQRWRVDMNEFYEELKKVLDLSDGDVWTETVLCGKDAGKKRILSGIFVKKKKFHFLSLRFLLEWLLNDKGIPRICPE